MEWFWEPETLYGQRVFGIALVLEDGEWGLNLAFWRWTVVFGRREVL